MKKIYNICISIILGIVFISSVHANNIVVELAQMPIEDLMQVTVSCVGFFDMPPEEAPGSIHIIKNHQLKNSPAVGLADMLDLYVSGIHVGNGSRNGASYAVRGMRMPDNSTTVFMYDRQNINTSAGLGVNMNLDLPLMGDIEQLEVIKGPCALVHGSGAMNGFVNIVPKNGTDHPGGFWRMQYGLKEQLFTTETGYGFSYGHNKDMFLYLGAADSDGFSSMENYGFEKPHHTKISQFFNKRRQYHCRFFDKSYRLSMNWNHHDFHFTSLLQNDRGSSNAMYDYLRKPMKYYQGMLMLNLSWKSRITPYETLEIHNPISFYDLGLIGVNIMTNKESDEGASEYHIEHRFLIKSFRLPGHAIAIGGLIGNRQFREGQYYLNDDPDTGAQLMDSDWDEFSIFFEDIFHIAPRWSLIFGFRHDIIDNEHFNLPEFINERKKKTDTYEQEDNNISTFRIAASYKLSKNDTLKLSMQEGYHQSNMFNYYEVFYGNTILQNDMKFEKMQSVEFNWNHDEPQKKMHLGLSLFLNTYEDSILVNKNNQSDTPPDDYLFEESDSLYNEIFGNGPSFASAGGEIDVNWNYQKGSHVFMSYAYTRPMRMDEDENVQISVASDDCSRWLTYPTHIIKGGFRQKLFNDRLSFNVHAIYHSAIDTKSRHTDRYRYYPPLLKVHANATVRLTKQLSFQVIGLNIFDNDNPPASFHFYEPWEGNLGEGSPLVYMNLNWRE